MASCELFGENLAAFELSCCRGWPDHPQTSCTKRIRDSGDKRSLRTDYGQVRFDGFGKACEAVWVIHINRQTGCYLCDPGITRRAVKFFAVRTGGEFPCDGVFAASRAYYEDSHG